MATPLATKLLLTSTCLTIIPLSVCAQESRAPYADPFSSASVHNWSGAYVGVVGGGAFGRAKNSDVNVLGGEGSFVPMPSQQSSLNISGALFGGKVGLMRQFDQLVVGGEVDFSWSGVEGSYAIDPNDPSSRFTEELNTLGTVRGVLGWAFDNILVYGTGGYAFADAHYVWSDINGNGVNVSHDRNIGGWTIGGGINVALTDQISLKAEYLYVSFDKESLSFDGVSGGANVPLSVDMSSQSHLDVLRLGLDYRFASPW